MLNCTVNPPTLRLWQAFASAQKTSRLRGAWSWPPRPMSPGLPGRPGFPFLVFWALVGACQKRGVGEFIWKFTIITRMAHLSLFIARFGHRRQNCWLPAAAVPVHHAYTHANMRAHDLPPNGCAIIALCRGVCSSQLLRRSRDRMVARCVMRHHNSSKTSTTSLTNDDGEAHSCARRDLDRHRSP